MIDRHLLSLGCFLALVAPAADAGDKLKPVKVFILAGQSNMEGQAVVDLDGKNYNDGKGTLKALMNDPAKAPLFKHLKNSKGEWTVRNDVWVRYQREKQPLLAGPLSIGFSIYGKHHFGPELQFGHVVGDHLRTQVLLIKTAWGGKSLYKDFRPPSSGGEVGPYYNKMLAEVRHGLENLKTDFPAYQGQGHELAGFVWYQGWNDGVDPKNAVPQYEENLVNLIKDVRKDLGAPKLPVVIGELTGPWVQAPGAWATLRQAQAKAADRPEFKGNVIFVETRAFVRLPQDSPNPGHGHHEFGNAETYFLVGDALGKGMVKLLASPAPSQKLESTAVPVEPVSFKHAGVMAAWTAYADKLTFGKGQTLALLDDGCNLSMPEWSKSDGATPKVLVAYNSVDGNDDPKHVGRGYHGSTIGIPSSLNYKGKRGVAFNNQLAVVRALECCHCNVKDSKTLAAGLQWVIDNHAKYRITAINLAPVDDLEHATPVSTEIDARLKRLRELGIWVSAPAGNHNFTKGISWPACQPDCFAIGAVRPGKDEVYLDRSAKIDLVVPAAATSSSNAILCGSVLLLREALDQAKYDWKKDGPTLPDAMMAIFQRTGVAVRDPATNLTFRRLDLKAALDHVFKWSMN